MSNTSRHLTLCIMLISFTFAACGGDEPAPSNNGNDGWLFNNGNNSNNDPMDMPKDTPDDKPDLVDQGPDPDLGPNPDIGRDLNTGLDIGSGSDMRDMFVEEDLNTSMTDCSTNNDCARSEVCCAGFDGKQTCTARDQCRFGGVCGSDSECTGRNETCCDLSSLGVNNKVCTDRCDATMGCQNNNECGQGEVCCPSFQGAPECKSANQCNSGGLCGDKMDCLNGQECCGFGRFKACLDQCSF